MPGVSTGTAILLSSIIGGGASVAASTLGKKGKQTTVTEQSGPQLRPDQKRISQSLSGTLERNLDAPFQSPNISAQRNQARTTINRATDLAKGRLETDLASRGFERSGQGGAGFGAIEANRVGALGDLEARIIEFLQQQETDSNQRNIDNALRFLPNGSPSSSTSTSTGGTSALGQGIQSGVSGLTSLFVLDKLLKQSASAGVGT